MTTILMLHAHDHHARRWLQDQLPNAARQGDSLIVQREGGELDAVLFAEELRSDAIREGHRLSIGLAERIPGTSMTLTVAAASRALRRARDLNGDITLSHSTMLAA